KHKPDHPTRSDNAKSAIEQRYHAPGSGGSIEPPRLILMTNKAEEGRWVPSMAEFHRPRQALHEPVVVFDNQHGSCGGLVRFSPTMLLKCVHDCDSLAL